MKPLLRDIKGTEYFVGVDLGQAQDYSAAVILEKDTILHALSDRYTETYRVRHLERFKLGTDYLRIVGRVKTIFDNPNIKLYGHLIVDYTGVGRAVFDIMRANKLKPIGITITSGIGVVKTETGFNVPKKELVTSLLILAQARNIKISKSLPEAKIIVDELENFKVKISLKTGQETYEAWREHEHDDLVLSLALASWYAQRFKMQRHFDRDEEEAQDWDIFTNG